jgi:hypothetical protein
MNGASVSSRMRGGCEDDCANIRRTILDVFSLDENVITPEDAKKGRVSVPFAGWSSSWEKGRSVPVMPMYRFGK